MPKKFNSKDNVLHLYNKTISYLIFISNDKGLIHLYFGPNLKKYDLDTLVYHTIHYNSKYVDGQEKFNSLFDLNDETSMMEFPDFGTGDYRSVAVKIKNSYGDCTTDFQYKKHKITKGKGKLEGLPSLYGTENDFTTLQIFLQDKVSKVEAVLEYNIMENYPIITRNVKLVNKSSNDIVLKYLYSACLDFPTMDYNFYYLTGQYCKERTIRHNKVQPGIQMISSLEGKSSHHTTPFCALTSLDACEDYGDVYSINFIYSGNFEIRVETSPCDSTRLLVGINPETFEYCLTPYESFQSPEAVLLYTNKGLGEMTRIYHKVFNNHLISKRWQTTKRPLLLNSWEGCIFDFDTEKLLKIIDESHELGIEMLVLDDGWFGKRNSDTSSLGDWYVNKDKVDLHKVINHLHKYNMKFGLWFEPEMICPDSDLYRKHPNYAIKSNNRYPTLMRHQMVLNMTSKEVCDNVYQQISKMLDEYEIDYIKWDHNRSITEAYSKELGYKHMGEFYHRFILGTYSILEKINTNYPNVLIESCCGGGGRYDAGMLYYGPQVWTSDETDAIARLTIQEGTSFCFPCSSMGSHVTANPRTNYNTKAKVAMMGTFGYELNPLTLSQDIKEMIKQQIKEYHQYYNLTHFGNLYRLISPSVNPYKASWMFVSDNKDEALFTYVVPLRGPQSLSYIKLKGLDENKDYYCPQLDKTFNGKFLMTYGLRLTFAWVDTGQAISYYFKEVK